MTNSNELPELPTIDDERTLASTIPIPIPIDGYKNGHAAGHLNGNGSNGNNGKVKGNVFARAGRVSTTHSQLFDPLSPVNALASQFQRYIYLPDPQILYAVLGAMAGNCMTGNPVWMMLVGASGGGKTLILKSLLGLGSRVRPVSSIKGEAAFLSGTDRKKVAKDATGGILNELGNNGCLLFLDLTTLMSKPKEEVNLLFGTLREMFDRNWIRDIGGEGGRSLKHEGRLCMMAGVTNIIDHRDEEVRQMGERCLYYRLPFTSGYQEAMSAVNQTLPQKIEEDLQNFVASMFFTLDLFMEEPKMRVEIAKSDADRIVNIAQFTVAARSRVPRDRVSHEVIDLPSFELATRVGQEMTQLYIGMERIGVMEEDRWKVLEKCAMDSMSLVRREAVLAVQKAEKEAPYVTAGQTTKAIASRLQIGATTMGRTLHDLQILGVVENRNVTNNEPEAKRLIDAKWGLTEWTRTKLRIDTIAKAAGDGDGDDE